MRKYIVFASIHCPKVNFVKVRIQIYFHYIQMRVFTHIQTGHCESIGYSCVIKLGKTESQRTPNATNLKILQAQFD
jgi:hypothetical protein